LFSMENPARCSPVKSLRLINNKYIAYINIEVVKNQKLKHFRNPRSCKHSLYGSSIQRRISDNLIYSAPM
jgi:hypothetical protein